MSRALLLALCGLLSLTHPGRASQPAAPTQGPGAENPLQLTAEVRSIFQAKCVDCHGEKLAKPKGKFGYVLDLKRVAANPDYIVPGNPAESDLYDQVFHDEMPGEDADVPPLTKEEKAKLKRWIEIGAPGEVPASLAEAPAPPPARKARPLWQQTLRWIGKFHPVSTHFPVALMLVALLAEALAWWTRRAQWQETVRFLVVLAGLAGLATGVLGWVNAYFNSFDNATGGLLWWHRWTGTAASLWAVLCAGLLLCHPCQEGSFERRRFRGALFVGAVLVGLSGFLGSALIYGLDHYAWR